MISEAGFQARQQSFERMEAVLAITVQLDYDLPEMSNRMSVVDDASLQLLSVSLILPA